MGRSRLCQSAGGIPFAAGGNVGVLSEGRVTVPRYPQPDILRHDALHADRHRVHGVLVSLARHDALVAELPLRQLTQLKPTAGPRAWPNSEGYQRKRRGGTSMSC